MPTSQNIRTVVLKSSFSAATVSEMTVAANATFTFNAGSASNKFEDVSDTPGDDKSRSRMKFANAAGAEIGQLTWRLVGKGEPGQAGVTVTKEVTREVITPSPQKGGVTLLETYDQSAERIWKQAALDSGDVEYVDDIAKLDIRADASNGYVVTQSVPTQTDTTLEVAYSFNDANGVPVVTGTIVLDTSITLGAGYHGGRIRVTDNIPTTGEERRRR